MSDTVPAWVSVGYIPQPLLGGFLLGQDMPSSTQHLLACL